MKQLFFGIAIGLVSLSACAQNNSPDTIKQDTIMYIADVAQVNIAEDHFFPIESNTLPLAVNHVVSNSYPNAFVKNAFVNKAEQYKLEIVLIDGRSGFLYTDRDGNWIER